MNKEKFLAILDKNINQEQMAKDIGMEFLKPELEKIKAKVVAKEFDPIPNTDIDGLALVAVIDWLLKQVEVEVPA